MIFMVTSQFVMTVLVIGLGSGFAAGLAVMYKIMK